jgi:hypothetical protein
MRDHRAVTRSELAAVLGSVFATLGEELEEAARNSDNHDASSALYDVASKFGNTTRADFANYIIDSAIDEAEEADDVAQMAEALRAEMENRHD